MADQELGYEALDVLRQIVENSSLAIVAVDLSGTIVLFNRGMERLTGFERIEILGKPLGFLVMDTMDIEGAWNRASSGIVGGEWETKIQVNSGRPLLVSIVWSSLRDVLGRPRGMLGILVDMTERKTLELELRQVTARAEFFNRILCRDIGTYSSKFLDSLDRMLDLGQRWTDRQRQALLVCRRQAGRMKRLIDHVEMMTLVEAGDISPLGALDVGVMASEVAAAVAESYPERVVESDVADAGEPVVVEANVLLQQVLFNVINNAVLHNPDDPAEVLVSFHAADLDEKCGWQIWIEDNGPGIPDELKEQIFNRFSSRRKSGSGVGLSVVRTLVESFGGRVWSEDRIDEDQAGGARIVVHLLRADT
ncbi:MAG: PAS domain S-box protein [Deltaproteobacteria bacterium]|nr:PAS domain S-box protein [Deltaproteobacteria bacterium]